MSPPVAPASSTTSRRRPEHWVVLGGAVAGLLLLISFGLYLEPDPRGFGTHERFGFRPCYPMQNWNLPCPGCGVTTSVTLASGGDLAGSLKTQPFGLLLTLVSVAFAIWAIVGHLLGRDLWRDLSKLNWSRWVAFGGTLLLLAWIYKIASVRGLL